MHWGNVHHVTTRMALEPKLLSANISTDQITVLDFVISAIIPFTIGIKEVVNSSHNTIMKKRGKNHQQLMLSLLNLKHTELYIGHKICIKIDFSMSHNFDS